MREAKHSASWGFENRLLINYPLLTGDLASPGPRLNPGDNVAGQATVALGVVASRIIADGPRQTYSQFRGRKPS